MSNEKICAKICKFWIDQWRPWSEPPCTVCLSGTGQTGLDSLCLYPDERMHPDTGGCVIREKVRSSVRRMCSQTDSYILGQNALL